MLVDIVSKNGNLLINIVQTPEGDLESDILQTLDEIGKWMAANGEGIYGTRPWKVFGEVPDHNLAVTAGNFNEDKVKYTDQDIRFTAKGNHLFSFCLNIPEGDIQIRSLGKASTINFKKILSIKMLGSNEQLLWQQNENALVIKKPVQNPDWKVLGFNILLQ